MMEVKKVSVKLSVMVDEVPVTLDLFAESAEDAILLLEDFLKSKEEEETGGSEDEI
jgi:hypothetical protein